jgi:hypothetical protein
MKIVDIKKGHDDAIPCIIEPTKPKRLSGKMGVETTFVSSCTQHLTSLAVMCRFQVIFSKKDMG